MGTSWHLLTLPLSRQRLFFWVLLLGFANVLVDKASRSVASVGWATATGEMFQISAIVFAAIAVSLVLVGRVAESTPATTADTAIALLVLLCTLHPIGALSRVGVASAALYLLWSSSRGSPEWRAGAIAASTGAYFIIAPVMLMLFAREIASIDAWLVATATGLERHGDLVAMRDQAGWLQIFHPCSSIHGISLSIVLAVTYSQWLGIDDWRHVIGVGAVAAITTAAFNIARLATLAEWPAHFEFFHTGWGATAFGAATFLAMLVVSFLGFARAPN